MSIFYFFLLSTSKNNNQGISCFHKSNFICLCYFYHICFIQHWLIGYFLKVSKFYWFLWVSQSTLQITDNSLRMCKGKYNSKNGKRCLFIVSKEDIVWFSRTMTEYINYQLKTSYKTVLSLKYLFHFFLHNGWLHFLQEYY